MNAADILVFNGTILTMDGQNRVIPDGLLTIEGDRISSIRKNGKGSIKAHKEIDAEGGLILPGLINSHTHAAMTLFRGLADDLPLMEWLNNYVFPVEGKMDADFVRVGSLLACAVDRKMEGRRPGRYSSRAPFSVYLRGGPLT
jgi:5-methylthioadenosine/S-adenosylhomocysteine deaminase